MKTLFSFLLLLCPLWLGAQSVSFKNIWLEHNVNSNGTTGMKVHVHIEISGTKDKPCKAIAYFEHPKGTGMKDRNERYCTTNGMVSASQKFTPPYENTTYENIAIFIPNDELHLYPGKQTYYVYVGIWDNSTSQFLGFSDYATFSGTGSSNQQAEEEGSTAFPDGQHFYYQMGNAVDLLHIDFYTDKTDGDRLCHVMQNGVLTFYEMTGVSSNGMEFRGVQFKPEYKMVSYAWSPFPVSQLTGRILNVDTGHRMTVAPGYGRVTLNGRTYDRPLSREAYNRIYDQVFGNGTSVPVTGGAGGSVSAPSGQVQSGMSASYYQETYDRWARVAESAYRSLTATGISVHNRKTDEHAGSAAGTWQGSNYAGMKSELRQAQNAMRDVRNEAQRNGITIRQSTWETATVGY